MHRWASASAALILFSFAVLPAQAAWQTNYVAVTGAGEPHDGSSWANAYTNVQDALDAGPSNVIYLKAETFARVSQLTWTDSRVTIYGG